MASLILLQGGEAKPHKLTGAETVIGRHPDCGIQLDSSMVSRHHARVDFDGNKHYLRDLGSGNGTFLNGKKVEGQIVLKHSDRIKLGPILLRFEQDSLDPSIDMPSSMGSFSSSGISFSSEVDVEEDQSSTIVGSVPQFHLYDSLESQTGEKLKGILKISRDLAGSVDIDSLLPKILKTLFQIYPHADRGCILLKDPHSHKLVLKAQKHRRDHSDETVRLSRTIIDKVFDEKTGILSADAANDERFQASESISNLTIRSMMCVPLLGLDGEPLGIINLDTQNIAKQFQKEDLEMLMAVAGQAALSYENTRLLISHHEKEKQDSEMEIARNVQRSLLPESLPEVDGYRFYASYESAQAVGGDYYDAMILDKKHVCLAFGDVAGKGVPGALIMSRLASVVESTMNFVKDIPSAIAMINKQMCSHAVEGRFVTFVLVIIDLEINAMSLAIAGHMSPMIRTADGKIDYFPDDSIGLPIGIDENYPYEMVTRKLESGETVVIVTDGVDEAMNPKGELFTKERTIEFVKNSSADSYTLGKSLLSEVRRHADGQPQNDDITIMAFGRI